MYRERSIQVGYHVAVLRSYYQVNCTLSDGDLSSRRFSILGLARGKARTGILPWAVAVAFYLILQFNDHVSLLTVDALTDAAATIPYRTDTAVQYKTKRRTMVRLVWPFAGVSIRWVAHPIVAHGPGVRRRARTSEVRVSRRSAVLHRFGPSAFGFGTFCTYTTNRFRPISDNMLLGCWCWCSSFHASD